MSDVEHEGTEVEPEHEFFTSTSYSGKVRCGICGSPVRNVPTMYETMSIEWRCAKCLRRDKPVLEEHVR